MVLLEIDVAIMTPSCLPGPSLRHLIVVVFVVI